MGEGRTDEHRAERGRDGDRHGDARAEKQAREDVPSERIRPEEIGRVAARRPGRRNEGRDQVLLLGIMGREEGREDRAKDHRDDDDGAGDHACRSEGPPNPCS